jgi:hypothetical protein
MRIKGHVLEVADCGDSLRVKLQGHSIGQASWAPWLVLELRLPIDDRLRAAYHIGREVTVEITPS